MLQREFPILEFDPEKDAFINPSHNHKVIEIAKNAVLCFFGEAIDQLKKELTFNIVYEFKAETYIYPVYEFEYKDCKVVIVHMPVGAPIAAGMIEELTAIGCNKFIACGGCGVLVKDLPVGHLLIPTSAVRDEGTSYHYLPPSREVIANPHAVKRIKDTLDAQGMNYLEVKTWTTDAFYRETKEKIQLRREEGCSTVEMEASAFMAAAQFRDVIFGQILYSGDDLSGPSWDSRMWYTRSDIRRELLRLSIDCCLNL